jgi:hypothetical protein
MKKPKATGWLYAMQPQRETPVYATTMMNAMAMVTMTMLSIASLAVSAEPACATATERPILMSMMRETATAAAAQ